MKCAEEDAGEEIADIDKNLTLQIRKKYYTKYYTKGEIDETSGQGESPYRRYSPRAVVYMIRLPIR